MQEKEKPDKIVEVEEKAKPRFPDYPVPSGMDSFFNRNFFIVRDDFLGKRVLEIGECARDVLMGMGEASWMGSVRPAGHDISTDDPWVATHIDCLTGTAEKLPVESGTVDVVILRDMEKIVGRMDDAMREIHRVLAPNGVLLALALMSSANYERTFTFFEGVERWFKTEIEYHYEIEVIEGKRKIFTHSFFHYYREPERPVSIIGKFRRAINDQKLLRRVPMIPVNGDHFALNYDVDQQAATSGTNLNRGVNEALVLLDGNPAEATAMMSEVVDEIYRTNGVLYGEKLRRERASFSQGASRNNVLPDVR